MKKMLFFSTLVLLLSCDDGDLQIDTIDFDSVDAQNCNTATIDTKIFFKINDDEALILELESGKLLNEASTEEIESTIGSGSTLTYRLFSEGVTPTYFCSDVPETSPTVTSEIEAKSGTVIINTVGVETDTVTFVHTIQLSEVSFVTDTDSRITDLTINEFGTVTTVKTE